jgi:hypothetical protein
MRLLVEGTIRSLSINIFRSIERWRTLKRRACVSVAVQIEQVGMCARN